jgi:hypothetical protein
MMEMSARSPASTYALRPATCSLRIEVMATDGWIVLTEYIINGWLNLTETRFIVKK